MLESRLLVILYFAFGALFSAAQSSTSIVCSVNQCLQGLANITLGETLSTQDVPSVLLLPGQYGPTTAPQALHSILTSSSATLAPSPGFNLTSVSSFPLNISLQPGIVTYPSPYYAGKAQFSQLPSDPTVNYSIPLQVGSLALSDNVWAVLASNSSSINRITLWEAIPDVSQLSSGTFDSLTHIENIQSSACSPPCSGAGICSASATCSCPIGFEGPSCEACAEGFFGPKCQPCPSACQACDQGISGTGRCMVPLVSNAPSTCNCVNGRCPGGNRPCICNPGWTTNVNGTACARCQQGFFLNPNGDCLTCQLGCSQCSDGTGACTSCRQGFTQDASDQTKCIHPQDTTSSGIKCPEGSYSVGSGCSDCSSSCETCSGLASNCILCATGFSSFNGNCVATDTNGVCAGSNGMVADNIKQECDACGAKCTSCKIPNFNVGSTVAQLECTGCLPGSFLSNGSCVDTCPSGTFVSPHDNMTCTACSSSCSTCLGSPSFCLTCKSERLAFSGHCVSTCPTGTVASVGACIKCHPDCASCSGSSFSQCLTCPSNLPVLVSGRCLPTCTKSQFFDTNTSSCQVCDSSCSSCFDSGPNSCLACSGSTQVLRAGLCVTANCSGASDVTPGLGVCLSDLLVNATSPTLPGSGNTDGSTKSGKGSLVWWKILLLVIGIILIFVVILWLWGRHAKKQRRKETYGYPTTGFGFEQEYGWRWRLARFKEKMLRKELPGKWKT